MSEVEPGKWRLRVFAGKDPVTGKRRQPERTFYGSKTAARRALAEFSAEQRAGLLDPSVVEPAWVSWRLQTLERLESWNNSTPHRSGTRLS